MPEETQDSIIYVTGYEKQPSKILTPVISDTNLPVEKPPKPIGMELLAPKSGSNHIIKIKIRKAAKKTEEDETDVPQPNLKGKWEDITNALPKDLDFSKDMGGPTGTGTLTMFYTHDEWVDIATGDEFLISTGWVIDGQQYVKEFIQGFFDPPEFKSYEITANLKDYGCLLEATPDEPLVFTQKKRSYIIKEVIKAAGLVPKIDFGDQKDDLMDFTSQSSTGDSSSGSGNCISGKSYPTSGCKAASWSLQSFSWENKCPACGAVGSLVPSGVGKYAYKGALVGASTMSGCTCSKCDSDYCPITGYETSGKCLYALTPCTGGGTQVDTGTTVADTGTGTDGQPVAGDTGQTETDSQSNESMSYWDCLVKLCDPKEIDLQIFTWLNNCYVTAIPNPNKAVLTVDWTKNLVTDTIDLKEGKPDGKNTVVVKYGQGKNLKTVQIKEKNLAEKYGTKKETITKRKLNYNEAVAFGKKHLGKLLRESEFSIECTIIGNPDWYIGRWAKYKADPWTINDTYYITKVNHTIGITAPYQIDILLSQYATLVEQKSSEKSTGSTGNMDAIGKEEAKFRDVQGVCSNADCFVRLGYGDCWADSEWLYNKLNAAGIPARIMGYVGGGNRANAARHAWVQINTGSGWTDWPYKKYGSQHFGDVGAGTPYVLIPAGKGKANIGATGY